MDAPATAGFAFDPGYLSATAELDDQMARLVEPGAASVGSLRRNEASTWPLVNALIPSYDVSFERYAAVREDGSILDMRWYTQPGAGRGSAVVYVHGGGMIMNDVAAYHAVIARYVGESGTPMLAVDYRLAPESPFPAALDDVTTALIWLHGHADELGIDGARIAVMGDSGGGCLAAGASLFCRDNGIALAAQILVYPMLDDRTRHPDPQLRPFVTWGYDHNALAWDAVLGAGVASAYAAPARATDLTRLPATYVDVGELDIFRAEIVAYAARLGASAVSTELHVHPGVPHGFDLRAPSLAVSRRALADRYRVLTAL